MTGRAIRIEVSQLPPAAASPNSRAHWAKRYRENKTYAEAVFFEACEAKFNSVDPGHLFVPFKRPVVQLTFVFRTRKRRDEDNLRAGFKAGQDALVLAGIFLKDDMANLEVKRPVVEVDPDRAPLTIIEIEEA